MEQMVQMVRMVQTAPMAQMALAEEHRVEEDHA